MAPIKQTVDLPDELRSATFSKKLDWVAEQGRKDAAGNPLYGTAKEQHIVLYRIGVKGLPYAHAPSAANAFTAANDKHAKRLGGRFEGTSSVYEEDKGKGNYRGWLLIRFIPDKPQVVVEGGPDDE